MIVLPTVLLALSGISGAGGIALTVKSSIDSLNVSSKNRFIQEKNERNLLRFESCSEKLQASLDDLGKQRMTIAKNFSVFINAFEKIKNKPDFKSTNEDVLPDFDIDEIKNVSVVADMALGGTGGVVVGSFLGAAAASGTTSLVMALGRASTGIKIAELSGIAKTNAALAALGGGAKIAGGGGIALGTIVLNATTLGIGALVQGLAMSYAGSVAKKKTDEAVEQLDKNEIIIHEAIEMQMAVMQSIESIKDVSVQLCNKVYKPLVFEMKDLVNREDNWDNYNEDEQKLVENNIHIVQLLNYLNNIPMYKVVKVNDEGEIEEVEANTKEVNDAIKIAKGKIEGTK